MNDSSAGASQCILYVEDDPDDRLLLFMAVKRGCPDLGLRIVGTLREGMDYLAGHPPFGDRGQFPLPALLLLDFRVDLEVATDLLEWLRRRPEFQDLPVIILSGTQARESIGEAYEAGATAFVEKPSHFPELVLVMQTIAECLQSSPPCFERLQALPCYRVWR